MAEEVVTRISSQLVGNMGLYYTCFELSKRGWNAMPTSRNARGIDIMIYSQDAKRKHAIQIKSLTKRNPVPLGNKIEESSLFLADYLIIVRNMMKTPEVFITTPRNIRAEVHEGRNDKGLLSYWLQPRSE